MDTYSFDNKGTWATLSTSQSLPRGITALLDEDEEDKIVCEQDCWLAAGPSLSNGGCPDRVLQLQGAADTVLELLSRFLVSEWPAEVHLMELSRCRATIFLDFVAVEVEARVMASAGGYGTELVFVNSSISPDTVLFGKLVHACEQHLRTRLGELPEGFLLKDELLQEDLSSELEQDDVHAAPQFQALLAEVVHCQSAKMREELLQVLAHLAGHSSARSSLAEAFCSSVGVFAASVYLQPQDKRLASLAEIYPFAYALQQAASCDESCNMGCLKNLIADALQNATSQLVAHELGLALSFLPEYPSAEQEGDCTDDETIPTRSKAWIPSVQDEAPPTRSRALGRGFAFM